jgi:hypothetical protein
MWLAENTSDRKLRLFAVACCRRHWDWLLDARSRKVVEVGEHYADGQATSDELAEAWDGAYQAAQTLEQAPARAAVLTALQRMYTPGYNHSARHAALAAGPVGGMAWIEERRLQSADVRDIFGNPFHPLPPRPEAIAALAEQMYAGAWDKMPLLGEWLQENGYWSEGEHCLDPKNQHVKGCWVVDWVTGRE